MTEKAVKLTKTSVEAATGEPGKQVFIWDTELRGFGLRIAPGGSKAYIIQRRVDGKTVRDTLGKVGPDFTPDMARRAALALASDFAQGINPIEKRKREKERARTLADAFDAYLSAPKKKGEGKGAAKKPRTRRDIEVIRDRHFSDWLKKPVTEITGAMVRDRHAKIAKSGPVQANLAFRYFRAVINHLIADSDEDDPILKVNPVQRLNRLNQWAEAKPKTGHIPDDSLAAWVAAVQGGLVGLKGEAEVRDAMLFILLTGARVGDVLGSEKDGYPALRWADIDLPRRIVIFRNPKNRRAHELPIGTALVSMLEERKKVAGRELVFSDAKGNAPEHFRSAIERIAAATGVRATAHDLRRTFASVANRLDIGAYKLKRLMNHVSGGDVTAGYVQVTTEDLRGAMQRIEDYILSPDRRADDDTNVVKLERRA